MIDSPWINVRDYLPEIKRNSCTMRAESNCVLIAVNGQIYMAHLVESWGNRSHFNFKACDCGCRGHDMEQDEWTLDEATHWMGLPSLPKEWE